MQYSTLPSDTRCFGAGCSRSQPGNAISESPHPCHDDSAFRRHPSSPATFSIQEVDTASRLTKTSNGTIRSRPGTAPADMQQERLFRRQPLLGGTQKARRVRGASGRVVETRLDELRADENMRYGAVSNGSVHPNASVKSNYGRIPTIVRGS